MLEWYRPFEMTVATTPLDHETLGRLAARVALERDIEVAVLFGSAARGQMREDSDVDVYLVLKPGVSWTTAWLLGLEQALCDVVGRAVDLVVEDVETTSTLLRLQVARMACLFTNGFRERGFVRRREHSWTTTTWQRRSTRVPPA